MLRSRTASATLFVSALLTAALLTNVAVPLPVGAAPATQTVAGDAAAERAEVRAKKAEVASQVDTMVADKAEIDAALADLDENVKGQEALVVNAQRAWEDADRRAAEAEQRAAERAAEVAALESQLATAAVNSYVNPPDQELLDRFKAATATEYAKKQALLGDQATRTGDVIDQLRSAKYGLEREQDAAEQARADATRERDTALVQIEELKAAQAQQEEFAAGLRERLNAKLAESAALEAYDKELAAQVRAEQDALLAQIRLLTPPPPAPGDPGPPGDPGTPTPPPIDFPVPPPPPMPHVPTTWVRGIQVATSVAPALERMLSAAVDAGHNFTGWGYRLPEEQIQLRRQNCGTTTYAIYYMDPNLCSPPTAIPGTSNHEFGRAIDFRWAGAPILTHDNPGYQWLAENAGQFGFYNLPSEPWHWSTSGR